MFKKAKKLNRIISSFFVLALFGFFACTMHIFEMHHAGAVSQENVAYAHQTQNKVSTCIYNDITLTNQNKDDDFDSDIFFVSKTISYYSHEYLNLLRYAGYNKLKIINKEPIYIQNSVLLI